MTVKIGINGFGRIGRAFVRAFRNAKINAEIVAVNDVADAKTLAHLLKYDSVFGKLNAEIKLVPDGFSVDGKKIQVMAVRDPAELPWSKLGVDIALESTGLFTDRDSASKHLKAGAKKVLISAPASNPDVTIVPAVNDSKYDPKTHNIISLASCTTNCVTPVVKVLHENFGILRGMMSTAHAYTNDQRILDLAHKDLRRARAAALSIIPTTTGATKATTEIFPELKGKINGLAYRVPVPDGSLVDFVAELKKDATSETINNAFKAAAKGSLGHVLEYSEEPLVSVDIIGNPHSCIIDGLSTMVLDGRMAKVLAWYDNEWGYTNRLVDMIGIMSKAL
ncbi:type I glyceraldehyde-3-phosphate dehydrogenase [archaeon]|nr:MAG: type I glyceraldehyde-3-phosphate dehydrogenase [archaeon]